MRRIYLASTLADKPRMRDVAAMLEKLGCTVVSTWIYTPGETYGTDPEDLQRWAVLDERGVAACDTFMVFADEGVRRQGQGGRHTELGIARALGKTIVAVGEPEQVFHYLPGIVWVQDVAALVQYAEDCQYLAWMEQS